MASLTSETINKINSTLESDWSLTDSGDCVFGASGGVLDMTSSEVEDLVASSLGIPTSSDNEAFTNALSSAGSNISDAGDKAAESWSDAFNDAEGWGNLADAAASAALEYFYSKLEKIKSAWTTPEEITIGDLVGEIAPYCIDFKNLGSVLLEKIGNMALYIATIGESTTVEGLGDLASSEFSLMLDSLLNDPSVESAVSNLKIIQALADTLDVVNSVITSASDILAKAEPYLPWVEIIADLALSYISGGTSTEKANQELSEYIGTLMQELCVKMMDIFRKLLFKIKLSMPSVLVGAIGTLKLDESQMLSEGTKNALKTLDSFLDGSLATNMEKARRDNSITGKYINKTKKTLKSSSSMLKSYSSTLRSGNLIDAPTVNSDGSLDWSSTASKWADPATEWYESNYDLWKEQKIGGYGTNNLAKAMQGYVSDARKAAGIVERTSYSFGNQKSQKKTSSAPIATGSSNLDDSLQISREAYASDEISIKTASEQIFKCLESSSGLTGFGFSVKF